MKKSSKALKILKVVIVVFLLVAVISVVTSIIIGLNQPAIEPTKIGLSLDEVIF